MFSLSQRSAFYHELGKLLVAGFPFLKSVETMLAARPSGSLRHTLRRLRESAAKGQNFAEAFAERGMPFQPMEISLIAACERSGQLHYGCQFLSKYFARLDATRWAIWKRAAYPLFIFHFGVVMLALPRLFQGESAVKVFGGIALMLACFYACAAAIYFLFKMIQSAAGVSGIFDSILRAVPVLGGIRKSLALSRFCTAYQMQLDAGVNIMDSLQSAGAASESALVKNAIRRILPGIREGRQPGAELAATGVFPESFIRSFVVGEQTGTLDAELLRHAEDHYQRAMSGIDTLGEWIPRLLYIAITIYLGWSIIGTFKAAMGGVDKMLEQSE